MLRRAEGAIRLGGLGPELALRALAALGPESEELGPCPSLRVWRDLCLKSAAPLLDTVCRRHSFPTDREEVTIQYSLFQVVANSGRDGISRKVERVDNSAFDRAFGGETDDDPVWAFAA